MKKLPTKVFTFLLIFVLRQWKYFLFTTIAALGATLANNTIWPYITGDLVDAFASLDHNIDDAFVKLRKPLWTAFGFWCFMEILQRGKGFILAHFMPQFEANIRMAVFEYVSNHSYSYFTNKYVGAIAHRIDDLPRSARLITDDVLTVFFPLMISVIFSSTIMFDMHPILAAIFIIWLLCYISLSVIFCHYASRYSSIQSAMRALLQGNIVDSIRNYLNTRIFCSMKNELKLVGECQANEVKKYRFSLSFIEKTKAILSILNAIGITTLFYVSIKLWQDGSVSVGNLTFIVSSTINILSMLWFAADEMTYVFNEMGICHQSLTIIQDPVEASDEGNLKDLVVTQGDIEFNKVTFGYNRLDDLFEEQSVKIKAKTKVGLVGASGSGKTTFVQLMLLLYKPNSGSIKIDGQDITKVNLESLRNNISFIQQDPILFHRSIMDNIRYGCDTATDEEVIMAAKRAFCHDFIERLADKYNTIVGETGSKLSGGQRQRIAIARAILKDAPILIMDEATSSLDNATEREIHESMEYVTEGKTVIIIAHRFSTLINADRILVFHNGIIVEDGVHKDLLERNGYYAKLWRLQNK